MWKIFQPEKTAKESLPSPYRYDTNKVRKVCIAGEEVQIQSICETVGSSYRMNERTGKNSRARNAARLVENLPRVPSSVSYKTRRASTHLLSQHLRYGGKRVRSSKSPSGM